MAGKENEESTEYTKQIKEKFVLNAVSIITVEFRHSSNIQILPLGQ